MYQHQQHHKIQMKWVFDSIRNIQYCHVCNKTIKKLVYSRRRCEWTCCSIECLDILYPELMMEENL